VEFPAEALELYGIPPEEFTARRDELSRRMKEGGDDAGAKFVRGLKRPSVAAYLLNLVARQDPDQIERLLDAGERLRGAGSRDEIQKAQGDRQSLISAVTRSALSVASDEGRSVSASLKEKVSETLLAVATDEEARILLSEGRLTREVAPGSLGPAAVFEFSPEAEPTPKPSDERADRLVEEAEGLMAEAKRLKKEANELKAEADRIEREAEAAADRAAKAEAAARRRLEKAEELRG
jgi:hypothetical protein